MRSNNGLFDRFLVSGSYSDGMKRETNITHAMTTFRHLLLTLLLTWMLPVYSMSGQAYLGLEG